MNKQRPAVKKASCDWLADYKAEFQKFLSDMRDAGNRALFTPEIKALLWIKVQKLGPDKQITQYFPNPTKYPKTEKEADAYLKLFHEFRKKHQPKQNSVIFLPGVDSWKPSD